MYTIPTEHSAGVMLNNRRQTTHPPYLRKSASRMMDVEGGVGPVSQEPVEPPELNSALFSRLYPATKTWPPTRALLGRQASDGRGLRMPLDRLPER